MATTIQVAESFKYTVITGTCDATAGVAKTFAHGLRDIPEFYVLIPTMNNVVYESAAADATNITLKSTVNSGTFRAICFNRSLDKVL